MKFFTFSLVVFSSSALSDSQLIDRQIARYSDAYPEIEFKLLNKIEEYDELLPFTESLGEGLSNLDYEHPEEARITLVEAQEYRIGILLSNKMSSATLFRTPNAVVTKKPYVCLITLSQRLRDQDPLAATRFMYDLDEAALESMPESLRIDNNDFLLYSVDHEIFHCVDAYMNGALLPRTLDKIKACRDRSRVELRTEAFSAMAHLSRHKDGTGFLKNLANARTLNLLSWDVEHYTSDMLYQLVDARESITTEDIKTLVQQSIKLAEKMTPALSDYKRFLVAAMAVVDKFGVDVYGLPSHLAVLADEQQPDPRTVKVLTNKINAAYLAIQANNN